MSRSHTPQSKEFMFRLAAREKAGVVAKCDSLEIDAPFCHLNSAPSILRSQFVISRFARGSLGMMSERRAR